MTIDYSNLSQGIYPVRLHPSRFPVWIVPKQVNFLIILLILCSFPQLWIKSTEISC